MGGGNRLGLHVQFGLPVPSSGGGKGKGEGVGEGKGGAAPFLSPIQTPPLWGHDSPLWAGVPLSYGPYGPYLSPGGSGNPSGTPVCTRDTPEPFRCPNTTFQYINLYLSAISRLLVMSMISSGTPNKLRSPKHITHKYKSSSNVKHADPAGSRTM